MYPTRLETVPCGSPEQACALLGVRNVHRGLQRVPVVFTPSRWLCSCHIVIPKGFVALITSNGSHVGLWGAGFNWAPPYVQVSHLIPTQYVVYDTPVKECPTQDNVMVTIDVTLILRILTDDAEAVYNFCYTLGPRGLDEMLKAFQEEAIRGMARKRSYNEIYDLMDTQQDKQLDAQQRELNDHFSRYGVEITDISVTNVHLPEQFANTMQESTIWHNKNQYKTLQQEFQLKTIDCRESHSKEKQKLQEELDEFTAEKERDVAELEKKRKNVMAETQKQLSVIKETETADVLALKSNSELVVAKIDSERDIKLSRIKSAGAAEADQIKIETETYIQGKQAHAEAEIAKDNAESLKLTAEAEEFAAGHLAAKRKYETKMRSLQSLRALANNNSLAISGNSKDNIMAQLLANQQNGAVLGINANLNLGQ